MLTLAMVRERKAAKPRDVARVETATAKAGAVLVSYLSHDSDADTVADSPAESASTLESATTPQGSQ